MNKQKNFIAKRLLMLFLLTASVCQGRADGMEALTLTVSGKPVVIALADHPVITYTHNTLHIKTATTIIDVPVSEISGGSFQDVSAIRPVFMPDMKAQDGEFRFSQLEPGNRVEVFTVGGVRLLTATADSHGQATVCVGRLPKGAYIIKSASQTIKIVNK